MTAVDAIDEEPETNSKGLPQKALPLIVSKRCIPGSGCGGTSDVSPMSAGFATFEIIEALYFLLRLLAGDAYVASG